MKLRWNGFERYAHMRTAFLVVCGRGALLTTFEFAWRSALLQTSLDGIRSAIADA
jgi:hypothetical protein